MSYVQTLINRYETLGRLRHLDGLDDMAYVYEIDRQDFAHVMEYIGEGDFTAAGEYLNDMDTTPREELVYALSQDGFDIAKLGFELA